MYDRNRDIIDRLKLDLSRVERELELLDRERENLLAKKKGILKEMGEYSDEKYEEDMLTMVYEQRKKNLGK